ncbi:MAG: hypothetical protein AAGF01_12145 [Cyanobacteria bacterium P01_G01_bin.38]
MLITIGWATALYFLTRRWLHQRQAWQWWHEQQRLQLYHQAESIRDDLLQQTFAFRRYLESTVQPEASQTERWIDRVQTFYQSLESLSNELSPPFVADSLPLALQFALKDWQRSHPNLELRLDLPADWPHNSPNKNQIVLSILIELLTLVTSDDSTRQHLKLSLSRESTFHKLTFRLSGHESRSVHSLAKLSEVKHLKEIFHNLAAGRLEMMHSGSTLLGQLYWRDG